MKYEWDDRKNISNIKKHKISFPEAVLVFTDAEAISIPDEDHSHVEERWITIGKITKHGIIVVVHTERIKRKVEFIRIISARKADKNEKKDYIKATGKYQ